MSEFNRADQALRTIDPDISDEDLMPLVADYLTATERTYLYIFHDVRPREHDVFYWNRD